MAGNGGAPKHPLISRGDDHQDPALGSIIESCFHGSLAFRGGLSERSAQIHHMGACPSPTPVSYVYAIGRIVTRFPRLSVEKEFNQAASRAQTAGQTDQEVAHNVLSKPENRYLARQLCWVLTVQGLETYILHPRDPRDFERLVEAIRPQTSPLDLDAVIGIRGPIASPEFCNGLMVPIVVFDQLYSFDRESLIKAIPRPEKTTAKQFEVAATEVFERILQVTDNAGATDEHRALNYLAMRYPGIYAKAADQFARDFSLTGVEVRGSPLSGTRKVVDCIFFLYEP